LITGNSLVKKLPPNNSTRAAFRSGKREMPPIVIQIGLRSYYTRTFWTVALLSDFLTFW